MRDPLDVTRSDATELTPQGLVRRSFPFDHMDLSSSVPERTFTRAELAKFNGRDGQPMYIAFRGIVYDVSASDLWSDGEHQFAHSAGDDLTEEMDLAPHAEEVLERVLAIGRLKD